MFSIDLDVKVGQWIIFLVISQNDSFQKKNPESKL
jgi:hypothetical protein